MEIKFNVLGTPAPKGSGRAMLVAGKARFVPGGSSANATQLKSWDANVREVASSTIGACDVPPFVDVPLMVRLSFRMRRPAGHWGKGRNAGALKPNAPRYPATKPDADKLARATLDSLTGIIFDDDSRIVLLVIEKSYADPGCEGATITVAPMR